MELRVLKYFSVIAKEGSIVGASGLLHVTQPTLSRQIKELEAELGQQLFCRAGHAMTLTAEGKKLLYRAEQILQLVDKTETEMCGAKQAINGEVRIGVWCDAALEFAAKTAKNVHEKNKNIKFLFCQKSAETLLKQLDRELLDLVIAPRMYAAEKYICTDIDLSVKWGVLAEKNSSLSDKNTVKKRDLANLQLAVPQHFKPLEAWLGSSFFKNTAAKYDGAANAAQLVKTGLCGAAISNGECGGLDFVLLEPALETQLCIIQKKDKNAETEVKMYLKSAAENKNGF